MAMRSYLRIFPLSEDEATSLRFSLKDFSPEVFQLRNNQGKNITIEINANTDIESVCKRMSSERLIDRVDIFLSIRPESDSFIENVPSRVIGLAKLLNCDVVVSGTF